jgi:glyoxylase-like metal-dependent hydrolase (beta-lactamase superfamily II)
MTLRILKKSERITQAEHFRPITGENVMDSLLQLTRRETLSRLGATAGLGAAAALLPPAVASAAVPAPSGEQAPGFYRFKLGSFEITSLTDGPIALTPLSILGTNAPEDELRRLLADNFLPTDAANIFTNVMLVNTGRNLALIDAGGGRWQPTTGRLLQSLAAAGIDPADVDTIVISHGHLDHLWGVADREAGVVHFPNATLHLSEPEWELWSDAGNAASFPDELDWLLEGSVRTLELIADRVEVFKAGAEIVPGIATVDAPGHTPGHSASLIESEGEALLCLGDAAVHPLVSFAHPEWHFGFDMDAEQASAARRRLLDRAATDRLLTTAYHMPFPGLGHVARDGGAYRWVPEPWRLIF